MISNLYPLRTGKRVSTATTTARRRSLSISSLTKESSHYYRLLYFDTRGVAEPIRYYMSIHGLAFQDARYPIRASAKGFGVDSTFQEHQAKGRFASNLNKLPILQIVQQPTEDTDCELVVAEIGQTHAILRFLASQHNNASGNDPLEPAYIDAYVEHIRDVKRAWYDAKREGCTSDFLLTDLPMWCSKLERSLPPQPNTSSPWLIGDTLSLADIVLYALLATPESVMTGSSQSFFDGASSRVVTKALSRCERTSRSIEATGSLNSVKHWEQQRPDTFS